MRAKTTFIAIVLLVAAGAAGVLQLTQPNDLPRDALKARTADLGNGETMFNIGGCASCHATPKPEAKPEDRLLLGGGLALHSPFGTFKAPNISSDPKAGIGAWSEYQFANAMLRGVGRNGEHLYPSFPYTSYQRMALDDVRDLYAYLRTLPAVATASEPHQLPFPFNVRRGLGLWKLLYLDGRPFETSKDQSPEFNRGAYLVEGPGHCAECHSPRNALGGIDRERRFSGGPDPEGKGYVPNITPHKDGLAEWTANDLAYMLETGLTPDGYSVGDSMALVIINTSRLSPADRNAMAAHLKSLAARPGKPPPKK